MIEALCGKTLLHSKRTQSCLLDAKTSDGISQLPICECTACRADARDRSRAIDREIARNARNSEKQIFVQLLGHTSATEEVTKTLLRLSDPRFRNVTTANVEHVLSYAKDTVKYCSEVVLREDRDLSDADESLLHRSSVSDEIAQDFSEDEMIRVAWLWREHCKESQSHELDERAYFLDNLKHILSPQNTPTKEDILNLPLCRIRPAGSICHTAHNLPSSASQQTTYNIISRVNSNSTSSKFASNFLLAGSFIYIIDLTTYTQSLSNNHPHLIVLNEALDTFQWMLKMDRFSGSVNFLWLTNVTRFREMVDADPESLESCALREYKASMNVMAIDEWLLNKFWSGGFGDDKHVMLLDSVDVQHVQGALEAMAKLMAAKSGQVSKY